MVYKLSFTRHAEKDIAKLPKKNVATILEHCISLESGKASLDTKKLHSPLNGFRMRVGNYRVLYVYEGKNCITVHAIRHRKDAYK